MKTVNCINFCANERELINKGNGSISQDYDRDGEFLVISAGDINEKNLPANVRNALEDNLRNRLTAGALEIKSRMVQEEHTL